MGFQIAGYHQLLCSELGDILDIRSRFRLEDFDLVVICADTIVPRELLEQFRAEIQAAEAEKLPISLPRLWPLCRRGWPPAPSSKTGPSSSIVLAAA
jgi:hypothetical protein